MLALRPATSVPSGLPRSFAAVAVAGALALPLLGGCATAPGTPAASEAASPSSSLVSPTPEPTGMQPTIAPSPLPARWEPAGTMQVARHVPSAVRLGDGRVLVLNDYDSTIVELWDPATNGWRATEPMNKARGEYVAVPLRDGRALVAGGINEDGESFSSAYLFDPKTERWEKSGLLGTARAGAAGAVLHDGRVLVAGGGYYTGFEIGGAEPGVVLAGFTGSPALSRQRSEIELADVEIPRAGYALATAELFDPATGTWSPTGSMRYARVGAAAVTLGDGRVLVWGGGGDASVDHRALSNGEIFDPATGRFSLAPPLPDVDRSSLEARGIPVPESSPDGGGGGKLVPIAGGDALLVGSSMWWAPLSLYRSFRFDTATDAWTEVGDSVVAADGPDGAPAKEWGVRHPSGFVAPLADGSVLFAGGYPGGRAAELLDPATGAWSSLPPMPAGRWWATAVGLADGSVLIIGGSREPDDPTVDLADALRFIPGS